MADNFRGSLIVISVMAANGISPMRMTSKHVDAYGCFIHGVSAGRGIFAGVQMGHAYSVAQQVGE